MCIRDSTGYIDYYLKNVNSVIDDVGYFPLSPAIIAQSVSALQALVPPQGEAGGYPQIGNIGITGSSTLAPLTVRMADLYRRAGFHDQPVQFAANARKPPIPVFACASAHSFERLRADWRG